MNKLKDYLWHMEYMTEDKIDKIMELAEEVYGSNDTENNELSIADCKVMLGKTQNDDTGEDMITVYKRSNGSTQILLEVTAYSTTPFNSAIK